MTVGLIEGAAEIYECNGNCVEIHESSQNDVEAI